MKDYRFKPKRQKPFLKHFKFLLLLFLVLLSLGTVFYFIQIGDFLKAKSFEVRGADFLSQGELLGELKPLVNQGFLGKVLGENNILAWNNVPFQGLYNKFPRIAGISINRDVFAGKVIIEVKEKEKLVIWCLVSADACYWVDENGQIFDSAPSVQGRIVRAVKDYSPERPLKVGDRVLPAEGVNNLNKIFDLVNSLSFSIKETKVSDIKYQELSVFLEGGPELRFSLNIDPRFGEAVLKSLSDSAEWQRIRYVDLRVENRVYYSR